MVWIDAIEALFNLAANHPFGVATAALFIAFTNAKDWYQAGGLGRTRPVVDLFVAFAEIFARFAVANNCVTNSVFQQHRR